MLRILLVLPLGIGCTIDGAARADDTVRCREILTAIKNRHDQYNPVYAKYTIQTVRTVYGNASSAGVEPADQRLFSKFRESRGTEKTEYARNGVLALEKSISPLFSAEGVLVKPEISSIPFMTDISRSGKGTIRIPVRSLTTLAERAITIL